jgi:flagellin-like protein
MRKRGISTVIASILVLAITVSLAVGLLTFGSSFMASQQKMQPPTTDQIKIENVYFQDSAHVLVTVRNVGTGPVSVTDIYVGGVDYTNATAPGGSGKFTPTISIAPGQAQTFTAQGNFSPGTTYTIKAATRNGGENTYTATY